MKTTCGRRQQPPCETVTLIHERHLFPKLRKRMEKLGSAEETFPGLAEELRGLQTKDVLEDLVLLEAELPAQDLRALIEEMMAEQQKKGRSCEYYQGSEDSLADLLSSSEEDEEESEEEHVDGEDKRAKAVDRISKRRAANEKSRNTEHLRAPVVCVLGEDP